MADPQSDDPRARALSALARGDTAAAIADLRAHVELEPDDEGAWLSLGTAFAAIGHGPEAASALARAVEIDGSVVDARLAYARSLRAVGKLDDAAFQLLQASRLPPEDARVLRELGIVFYDKHLYDKAVTWLQRAAAAAPEDGRASYALGLAHEARKDPGAAVAAYREALRRQPDLVDARRTLADLYATMGEHERAVEQLEALLARERSDEQAAHNREVLLRALAEMNARRLLGKTEHELELSALVQEGHLVKKERVEAAAADGEEVWRWAAPLTELRVTLAPPARTIRALHLVLTDPDRAARRDDDTFKVTVVAEDGRQVAANYATAVSLTFLREALGCPMTHASGLYQRLLAGEPSVEWRGLTARFASVPRHDRPSESRHGILVEA
ncbi:MAG: tetratricopeptide repeat protein [Polyangiaceae bacterium]